MGSRTAVCGPHRPEFIVSKWFRPTLIATCCAALALGGVLTQAASASAKSSAPAATAVPTPVSPPSQPFDLHTNNDSEMHFVPITPCRIVDTRKGGGIVVQQTTRHFRSRGSSGFAAQGGHSDGCGIPVAAAAVSASLTTVNSTGDGYLNAWPSGENEPLSTLVNYFGGKRMSVTTNITLADYGSSPDFDVRGQGGSTHLIVDVLGYYEPAIVGTVTPAGTIYGGSNRVLTSFRNSVGKYTVQIDRNASYCIATVTTYDKKHYSVISTYSASVLHIDV
jgi:hypothetical protein